MNISRTGKKTEKGIKLTTETITDMTREEFETLLVDAFNQKVNMNEKIGLMKHKLNRLSKTKIELTDEMKEFMKKIEMIDELKGLENLKSDIKEMEEKIDLIERDLIQLRVIQSEIYKDTNKGKEVEGTFIK